jgi:hypothetical protein
VIEHIMNSILTVFATSLDQMLVKGSFLDDEYFSIRKFFRRKIYTDSDQEQGQTKQIFFQGPISPKPNLDDTVVEFDWQEIIPEEESWMVSELEKTFELNYEDPALMEEKIANVVPRKLRRKFSS